MSFVKPFGLAKAKARNLKRGYATLDEVYVSKDANGHYQVFTTEDGGVREAFSKPWGSREDAIAAGKNYANQRGMFFVR